MFHHSRGAPPTTHGPQANTKKRVVFALGAHSARRSFCSPFAFLACASSAERACAPVRQHVSAARSPCSLMPVFEHGTQVICPRLSPSWRTWRRIWTPRHSTMLRR